MVLKNNCHFVTRLGIIQELAVNTYSLNPELIELHIPKQVYDNGDAGQYPVFGGKCYAGYSQQCGRRHHAVQLMLEQGW